MKGPPDWGRTSSGRSPLYAAFDLLYGPLAPAYEWLVEALHDRQWKAWQHLVWADQAPRGRTGLIVLEIGCGTGRFLEHLDAGGHTVVGVDFSERMLRRAIRRRCAVVQGSVADLPFRTEAFDTVAGMFFPIRALRQAGAWAELARVLKPGGTFVYLHWATMRGMLYPALRRAAYGARYRDPLGDLPTFARGQLDVAERIVVDPRGHALRVLVGRKAPAA